MSKLIIALIGVSLISSVFAEEYYTLTIVNNDSTTQLNYDGLNKDMTNNLTEGSWDNMGNFANSQIIPPMGNFTFNGMSDHTDLAENTIVGGPFIYSGASVGNGVYIALLDPSIGDSQFIVMNSTYEGCSFTNDLPQGNLLWVKFNGLDSDGNTIFSISYDGINYGNNIIIGGSSCNSSFINIDKKKSVKDNPTPKQQNKVLQQNYKAGILPW